MAGRPTGRAPTGASDRGPVALEQAADAAARRAFSERPRASPPAGGRPCSGGGVGGILPSGSRHGPCTAAGGAGGKGSAFSPLALMRGRAAPADMACTVVVGGFFGDEGKGKIISHLAGADDPAIVVRGGAGPNAGHTIRDGAGRVYKVRMMPTGFLNAGSRMMIGPGVLVRPGILLDEVERFGAAGRVFVDAQCGVIDDEHVEADSSGRLRDKIGSTGSGTGPANAARALRTLRLASDVGELAGMTADVPAEVNGALDGGRGVLVEGTQGTFLSLWHGTYPYVTSKDVSASAICADVGVGPRRVDEVIVAFKAYVTRVGTGRLDGELGAAEAEKRGWAEFGTVTGRPRRAAEFDYALARRAVMLNSATQAAITKLDARFPGCAGATSYDDLPAEARGFVERAEAELGVPATLLGTGPGVGDIIDRRGGGG